MKETRDYRNLLKGNWEVDAVSNKRRRVAGILEEGDPRIAEAERDLEAAQEAYRQAKKAVTVCRRADELVDAYKRFALEVAGDTETPDLDAERARDRYLRALRQLEEPTEDKVRELSRQLKDLQKSQVIRDEKRKALRQDKQSKGANDFLEK